MSALIVLLLLHHRTDEARRSRALAAASSTTLRAAARAGESDAAANLRASRYSLARSATPFMLPDSLRRAVIWDTGLFSHKSASHAMTAPAPAPAQERLRTAALAWSAVQPATARAAHRRSTARPINWRASAGGKAPRTASTNSGTADSTFPPAPFLEALDFTEIKGPKLIDESSAHGAGRGGGFQFLVEVLGLSEAGFTPARRETSCLTDVRLQASEHSSADLQDLHGS